MLVKILLTVIFLAVTVYVGIYSRKQAKNVDGFVLGGRSVGPWLSAFAFVLSANAQNNDSLYVVKHNGECSQHEKCDKKEHCEKDAGLRLKGRAGVLLGRLFGDYEP